MQDANDSDISGTSGSSRSDASIALSGFNVVEKPNYDVEVQYNNHDRKECKNRDEDNISLVKEVLSNSPVFDQSLDTEIPVIQITESSLPPSTPTSPLNACPEEDPFQAVLKEEQTCYLQVPSSDEDSDENDIISVEQNFTNDSRTQKFNPNELISTSLVEQASKGVFMRARRNTLHEIQEEESSDIEDYEYESDSISDAASYNVALEHKQGY